MISTLPSLKTPTQECWACSVRGSQVNTNDFSWTTSIFAGINIVSKFRKYFAQCHFKNNFTFSFQNTHFSFTSSLSAETATSNNPKARINFVICSTEWKLWKLVEIIHYFHFSEMLGLGDYGSSEQCFDEENTVFADSSSEEPDDEGSGTVKGEF